MNNALRCNVNHKSGIKMKRNVKVFYGAYFLKTINLVTPQAIFIFYFFSFSFF